MAAGSGPGRELPAEEAALEVSWVQGFSNKSFGFINNQTVCYPCGNYILFLDIETKKTTALQCQTGPVGAFAANASSEVVAFSNQKLNPIIYIHHFPELNKLTELKGSAQLDYTLLAFSFTGPYLASYSSIPEFILSVWNWQENILLCSESQPGITATSLSFNPMNWQQLCFVGESSVTIWHIERIEDEHHLKRNPVELPDEQGSISPHEDLFFPVSRSDDPYHGPDLPVSAIAGLVGDEAETFVPRNSVKTSVHPTAHCWTATSEIYMSCKEGYILAIDADKHRVSILQPKPPPEYMQKISDVVSYVRREVQKKKGGELNDRQNPIFSMAFCNEGLYAAGRDGILLFYHIKDLQYEMKVCADISQSISSLIFSPDYASLLLVTDQGPVYSYKPAHSGEAVKLLDTCSSCFLAADFLTPGNKYCVSVTISGEVQVWLLEDGTCLSKLNLDIEATAMACCPSSNSVAVGTKRGQIYFLDVTKAEAPRVVHRIFLSNFPVLSLHYDQSGQFLIARTTEGHVFILDARPSKLFQVLGYIVLADEVLDLSVVSDLKNDLVEVMVLLNVAEVQRARLEIFCLSSAITTDNDKCVNDQGMFNASAFKKKQYELDYPLSSAVKLKDNTVYGFCTCAPFICKYHLSEENMLEDPPVFSSEKRIPSNQFGSGFLCVSPNSQWLAAAAKDGVLFIYNISTMVIREETQRFSNQKQELQMGIKKLRQTIQQMMHENEQVPDIEKLEHQEFNLDMEEQERLQAEAEQEVARARKEIEMENLSNCYLQDFIKYECWDALCVKGRAVKCFHMDCEVKNYPLEERSKEELETLEKVLRLKDTETADLKVQKEDLETETVLPEEEGKKEAKAVADDGESFCLIGSLSSQYGGDTSILYHQCDLHTKEQRVNQIVLLKDIIYKVKTAFNKEFDIVAQQKEQEIARVKERNLRIREILEQLDLQVEVWEPALTDDEMPERALTVQDSEIKAEKYLTQEEKERAEMLAKLEMEKRLAATDDDRLRALDDMMGGVLEVRKEDILKMNIPPPPFISKPEDLWSDEEKKIFGEYEKKVKELNEEKEEYKKTLENEWKKLEASIHETTQNFDETVCKLSERKVKSEMVIYQEELKIVSLTCALLLDEELDTREAGLHNCLIKKKKEKVKKAKTVLTAKSKVDAYTGTYKDAVDEEKTLERHFRKQFADTPDDALEELYRLYTHRPKSPRTEMLLDTPNPYGNCSGSEDYEDALNLLMKAMDELDSPEHMPEGLEQSIWKNFCLARRKKMESEELVKRKALTLAEIQAFFQRRMDENEKMKSQIENIFNELTWLQEKKMKLQQNLTVQFVLKQGQVELENTEIPDYSDAILIKKSVVEELNCSISTQGEKKIAAIIEFKDFSRGIRRLEWEHKKMRMQIEDLKEKARDIVILPISKDCQLFLTVQNYGSHIAQHIAGMEETLRFMDKLHEKNVKNHRKKIRELKKSIRLKEEANYELSLQLKEMLVSVSERRHIFEAADTRDISEKIAKQRYQEILKQKNLRDLIKEQKEEFASLQSELEILRTRTPPHI
ncbi:cilia- and flagella-associated protein 43 isoform X4 [Chiroxiphia lanceolata]|uniref:cilia- and flagella-associated protein 43 isoform X4 n=1 Tax=Chiroxiphia lanceolata TaxID=296741 RepID=UPI0013CED1B4|nr:cilia- and flagella-associated protein 43 isoform X4 [Chiroxiphia lanceolata]